MGIFPSPSPLLFCSLIFLLASEGCVCVFVSLCVEDMKSGAGLLEAEAGGTEDLGLSSCRLICGCAFDTAGISKNSHPFAGIKQDHT